jgi:hypothetical protein
VWPSSQCLATPTGKALFVIRIGGYTCLKTSVFSDHPYDFGHARSRRVDATYKHPTKSSPYAIIVEARVTQESAHHVAPKVAGSPTRPHFLYEPFPH